mgnify:CR=1 FL=1
MAHAAVTADHFTAYVREIADDKVVLHPPGTDYRLHLVLDRPLQADVGDRVEGVVRARAKRVDVVPSGGRYVEPGYGRPRRAQGMVVGGDAASHALKVHCGGCLMLAELTDPRQRLSDFKLHQLVSFDVERGARFEPHPSRGSA